jgi:hypothetical protein
MLDLLAQRLRDEVVARIASRKKTLFLCGKSLDDETGLRAAIAREIGRSRLTSLRFALVYPEELFEELLSGPFHKDLLSRENLIADAVDAIVLVPESPGSLAELGAFANHEQLRRRLVCVQDIAYRRKKSFVNYGPIRLLTDKKVGKVVYINPADIRISVRDILKAVGSVSGERSPQQLKAVNAINADRFLLACLFVLDDADEASLLQLVAHASDVNEEDAAGVLAAGLAVLRRRGFLHIVPRGFNYTGSQVTESPSGFMLTKTGVQEFNAFNRRSPNQQVVKADVMDQIRFEILSHVFRKRKVRL